MCVCVYLCVRVLCICVYVYFIFSYISLPPYVRTRFLPRPRPRAGGNNPRPVDVLLRLLQKQGVLDEQRSAGGSAPRLDGGPVRADRGHRAEYHHESHLDGQDPYAGVRGGVRVCRCRVCVCFCRVRVSCVGLFLCAFVCLVRVCLCVRVRIVIHACCSVLVSLLACMHLCVYAFVNVRILMHA